MSGWVEKVADMQVGQVTPDGYNTDVVLAELARRVLSLEARLEAVSAVVEGGTQR